MRRFITLATIALIVAAVVKQRQRVRELGRQALSGRTTGPQWQRVQGLTRQVLSRGTTEETSVSTEENKALARRVIEEIFSQGNLDAAEEIYSPSYVAHDPASPEEISGPEGIKQFVSMYRSAFPDLHETIEDQIAEEDKVVTRWTGRGTHQGELLGIPPTGNRGTVAGISIDRISGGKVEESWFQYDALGMMRQIGAVPEPGQGES